MNFKSCIYILLSLVLLGCPEQKTEYVDRQMNLDLVACFGEIAELDGAQTCRTRLSDGVIDAETNGCLLIRVG